MSTGFEAMRGRTVLISAEPRATWWPFLRGKFLATLFMASPAGARIGRVVDVLDPLAYATSLLCIVAACALAASLPALRAARIDPIATLRQE